MYSYQDTLQPLEMVLFRHCFLPAFPDSGGSIYIDSSKLLGVPGVWMTMPMAEAVTIFIAVYLYRAYGKSYIKETVRSS